MSYYDEVEIEDLEFDSELETYFFPCPCGDRFQITLQALKDGEDVARCPSCSLIIKVIYSPDQFEEKDKKEKAKDDKLKADAPAISVC